MGLQADMNTGIGNTGKGEAGSLSGTSNIDIHNYSEISIHMNTNGGKPAPANIFVMKNKGCVYNGKPMWSFEDGYYDGDWDTSSDMGRLKHSNRFGSAICTGQSHQLRFGSGGGVSGSWEFVTHGRVSAWTTATTQNFFGIQGTGNTETGVLGANTVGALGTWSMVSASTTDSEGKIYGTWTATSGGTALGASFASISAITAFGVIH